MPVFVDEDVVWFDVTKVVEVGFGCGLGLDTISNVDVKVGEGESIPMNEPKFMDSLDREHAFRHIESGDVLRECIVLD